MNVTFRQLRLFLALADTGSVSGAAKQLHITQPTASDQLKEITNAVGLPLYQVISKKIYLTDLGKELAITARRINDEWGNFTQIRDATRGLNHGRLKIAAVSTAKYFIPGIVGEFCKKHPAIDVSLEILNRDGVVSRLRENRDEIYIMSIPPTDLELEDDIFMDNPLVLIAPRGHRLVQSKKLRLSDLATERFILRELGSGTRMAGDRHFADARFQPQIRLELGSNEAIKESVAAGLGVGIVSIHALKDAGPKSQISVLNVSGFPIASRWHVVYPKNRSLSPIASAFHARLLSAPKLR